MFTTIPHLPEEQIKQLILILQRIVTIIAPDKIICYGYRATNTRRWSAFLEANPTDQCAHLSFDLLVIPSRDDTREDHVITQIAEQQAIPPASVNCIVHKIFTVNDSLIQGSRFFTGLYNCGVSVYDATTEPLFTPPDQPDIQMAISKINEYWEKEYGLAHNFWDTACHTINTGYLVLTAFLLHQATEHTLTALIRAYTGYRCNTHNVSKLLALTGNFSMDLLDIFPCNTKFETDLFSLLQRAYSEGRYKHGYNITIDKAAILIERVKGLQSIAESLYREKLQSFNNIKKVSFPLVINQ